MNHLGLPHEFGRILSESQLCAFVVAPRVNVTVNRDSHSVRISTAHLLDEFVLEDRYHAWIEDFLCHAFLGQMCKRIKTKLTLSVGAPGVKDAVNVSLVNRAILRIDYRLITA